MRKDGLKSIKKREYPSIYRFMRKKGRSSISDFPLVVFDLVKWMQTLEINANRPTTIVKF